MGWLAPAWDDPPFEPETYVPQNVREGFEYVEFRLCRVCYGLMATHKARAGKYSQICPDCVGNRIMK